MSSTVVLSLLVACFSSHTILSFSLQPALTPSRPHQNSIISRRSYHPIAQRHEISISRSSNTRSDSTYKRTQLRWIQGSIKKLYKEQEMATKKALQEEILEATETLVRAKTPLQVVEAGRKFTHLDLTNRIWFDTFTTPTHIQVLERVSKATAMTGLFHIALNITSYLLDNNHVPSDVCQDAVCTSLRKGGKLKQLENFMLKVGKVAISSSSNCTAKTSQFAYNIFIATLCDIITDKTDRTFWAPVSPKQNLERAASWLDPAKTKQLLGLEPDSVSYGTVINAATEVGNTTLAQEIWDIMLEHSGHSNVNSIQLYNTRMKSLKQDDEAILELWEAMQNNPSRQPDPYSIDLVLLPLLRAGRIGDIEKTLDQFVFTASHVDQTVTKAFISFLCTLVYEGKDVAVARAIFDMYIAPSLAPVLNGPTLRLVRPHTRHFNTVIEGYRRLLIETNEQYVSNLTAIANKTNTNQTQLGFGPSSPIDMAELRKEAWKFYKMMLASPKTPPDEFTVSSMMALCSSSEELTDLLDQAIHELGINCTSAILRGAITAYGDLGDPSSACALFAKYVESPVSTRYWNVLLGALSRGKSTGTMTQVLNMDNSRVNRIIRRRPGEGGGTVTSKESNFSLDQLVFVSQIDGLSCWKAVEKLVNQFMKEPNSQTYCLMAKAAQYIQPMSAETALEIFRNATAAGVPADGRFVNAVIRCFGDDWDAAILAWKQEIRQACFAYEHRIRPQPISPNRAKRKNLLAAYHGLIYVSGRALRPDIALRLVYAMAKEGLEVDETALNCYKAGKRIGQTPTTARSKVGQRLRALLKMEDAYESLLYVECVKYDQRDKRREGEKRIRIII